MPLKTPICDFGQAAKSFELKSTNNEIIKLNDVRGENGTLVMFICNHCPYVIAVIEDIIEDYRNLKELGIKAVAICSNDSINYPDDSFDKMIKFHKNHNFNFPYLTDETQVIAKSYGAVCTPDFFGYNKNLELQYRGRIRELKNFKPIKLGESDLFKAMKKISETGKGPEEQVPSMGCGIKWLDS
jgi:peroxiredoxin